MLLTEYISGFLKTINDYSKTGLIISFDLTNDLRTEKIGLVKGYVVFSDESILYFTEYLDVRYKIDKLSYSFHYQNKDGELIFRYDNSKHKPELTFYNHKHLRNGTISESFQPNYILQ
ncbi:MAG: hypothetical protein MAG551_01453 [Candidatus Scalindua arabica]|uniref:Uncharacterized protein n=1 Tax=Candidatus Scalindua arabica TaxID=1127984 RepID=A0A941W2N0_9BACT|nr:hypothetical protein [Candidatus Scalindua arabica]